MSSLSPRITPPGAPWHVQNSGTTRALFAVDFLDDNEGFAVGGGGTILRTLDGGHRWEPVASGQTYTLKRVNFADEKNGWIVGFNGAILRSQDGGRTWEKVASPSAARLFGLYITKKYGFAVGEKGLVLEYSP